MLSMFGYLQQQITHKYYFAQMKECTNFHERPFHMRQKVASKFRKNPSCRRKILARFGMLQESYVWNFIILGGELLSSPLSLSVLFISCRWISDRLSFELLRLCYGVLPA